MSWSHVATSSGSGSSTPFSPTWPTGAQEGDVVIFCCMWSPDAYPNNITSTGPGWNQQTAYGESARFQWCRYSSAQPLPTLTTTGTPTYYWYMVAFRSTNGSSFGRQYGVDGSPPAATTITTTTPETLIIIYGSVTGDQTIWTMTGGFTALINVNGSGSGNPNANNTYIGYQSAVTPATLSNLKVTQNTNRYYLLEVGESTNSLGLFF